MKLGVWAARIFLGAVFLVIGLNEFLHFLSVPESVGLGALAVFHSASTGNLYVTMFACIEIIGGALLLFGLYVPLALIGLAPVLAKVLTFHIVAEPVALPFAALDWAVWAFLAWSYRVHFRGLLTPKGPSL